MKKLNKKRKENEKIIVKKFEIFCENHLPTSKVINFASSNTSIMANKLLSTNLEQFLRQIKLRLRVSSA